VLVYSTLLGGRDRDLINDIAVDAQGSVYFCGSSASTNFPLRNPIQADNKGGGTGLDAIFGKLNPTGTGLVYATFYGGNYTDRANACTIDAEGSLYVTGYSDIEPVANRRQWICDKDRAGWGPGGVYDVCGR
jgi:hypothetical protein